VEQYGDARGVVLNRTALLDELEDADIVTVQQCMLVLRHGRRRTAAGRPVLAVRGPAPSISSDPFDFDPDSTATRPAVSPRRPVHLLTPEPRTGTVKAVGHVRGWCWLS
jgi:hypothetical protein